jgi:hypothetical protein
MGVGTIEKRPAFERYFERLSRRPAAIRARAIDALAADNKPPAAGPTGKGGWESAGAAAGAEWMAAHGSSLSATLRISAPDSCRRRVRKIRLRAGLARRGALALDQKR